MKNRMQVYIGPPGEVILMLLLVLLVRFATIKAGDGACAAPDTIVSGWYFQCPKQCFSLADNLDFQ